MRPIVVIPATIPGGAERHVVLDDHPLEIGGAIDCDVRLDHEHVGDARVRFERQGEHWVAIAAAGACSVGGLPLNPGVPRIVRAPHRVRIGRLELAMIFGPLELEGQASTRELALRAVEAAADAAPLRPRIRIVEGRGAGASYELSADHGCIIGRGDQCDVVLDEADASREHAFVSRRGDVVVVRDRSSRGGVYLGRARIEPERNAIWDPGVMLRVAQTVFSLELPNADILGAVLHDAIAAEETGPATGEQRVSLADVHADATPAGATQAPEQALDGGGGMGRGLDDQAPALDDARSAPIAALVEARPVALRTSRATPVVAAFAFVFIASVFGLIVWILAS